MLRAHALDDAQRASTMAVFRLLLNLLVVTALPLAGGFPEGFAFGLCISMLCACLFCIQLADRARGWGGVGGKPGLAAEGEGLSEEERFQPEGVCRLIDQACDTVMDTIDTCSSRHSGGKYRPVAIKGEVLGGQQADCAYKKLGSPRIS
ncbi:MAG: hypothetical protein SGPRY_008736, partial [Prymnesium sp.]